MKAVEIADLGYSYPEKTGARSVLKGVSFSVEEGEIFGLLGPNGAGKTTLFRLLSTLAAVQEGSLKVFGVDAAEDPAAVRRLIGVVFQNPALDKRLTVAENLSYQGRLYGLSGTELKRRIEKNLIHLGIAHRAEDVAGTLSGGLQRRAELAKGFLHRPRLLILDEPSTGLDPGSRKDLWDYLKLLRDKERATVLVTTHWMEEAERCDRLVILHEGRVVAQGAPAELKGAIGGDVITLESPDAQGLALKIAEKFGGKPQVVDGTVRLERPEAHRLIPQLAEAFPGLILSTTLSKPSLEDVFIDRTGHRFWKEASK